jgi:hypothetical protein
MATVTLSPTANGSWHQLTHTPGYDHWECALTQGDAKILTNPYPNPLYTDTFVFSDTGVAGVVNSVVVYINVPYQAWGATVYCAAEINGSLYSYAVGGGSGNMGWILTTNPDTGLAWTMEDINSAEFGTRIYAGTGVPSGASVDKVWAVVDYDSYPSYPDSSYRVTKLRHVYRPGSYRLEMGFGDVSTDMEVPKADVVLPSADTQPATTQDATKVSVETPKISVSVPKQTAADLMKAIRDELNIPENMPQGMLDWESKYYYKEYEKSLTNKYRQRLNMAGAQGMLDWEMTTPAKDYRGRLSTRESEPKSDNIIVSTFKRILGMFR